MAKQGIHLENGFSRLANDLIEKFAKTEMNATSFRVLFAIVRKTYGWNKKEDSISLSQIKEMTGLDRSVVNAIKELENLDIIKVVRSGYDSNKYIINKNYELNVGSAKYCTRGGSAKVCNKVVQPTAHTKETIQKKCIYREHPSYKAVFSAFDTINTSMKTKITKEENTELIKVGLLWQDMASKTLGIPKADVVMKNIYYPIRNLYDKHGYKFEDFKKLFTYFFSDSRIKYEDKLSFDLCMSEKYHAKYKLSKKSSTNISAVERFKL